MATNRRPSTDRKPKRDDREDEIHESRRYAEIGKNRGAIQMPSSDNVVDDNEDISTMASLGREQPGSLEAESELADKSRYYGQGFGQGTHGGYEDQYEADKRKRADSESKVRRGKSRRE